MAILNILKSLDLPVLGKSTYRTEDQFLSNNEFQLSNGALGQLMGNNAAANPQEIMIACKGKRRRVIGYLSQGVKLVGTSEWEDLVSTNGISEMSQGVSTINKLGQLGFAGKNTQGGSTAGSVIQQPWLDRKFWKHSKSFDLNFDFNLVAESSAKDDVFLPAIALLSFCYPREINNVALVEDFKTKSSPYVSNGTNSEGGKNLAASVRDTLRVFAIPGPSLMYGAKREGGGTVQDNGDAVTIVIGNMFAFGACYLKQVVLELSPNMDYSGYPVWCKCSIQAEAMDSNYCAANGDFNVSQWANTQNDISEVIDAARVTVKDAAQNAMNIAKTTANAIGAFGQILDD